MNTLMNRREFLPRAAAAVGATATGLTARLDAAPNGRRIFLAGFAHETNTFHPVPTQSYSYSDSSGLRLAAWKERGLEVVRGVSAHPSGGGTIAHSACREAMERVLASLRAAQPVDAVFLRLHGAMYAEGVGPAETELARQARALVGPKVPIACTFDLHGNIPARLAEYGDILVGLKTAPHTDGPQTSELAERILLETLDGKARPTSYILPIPMILQGEKAMTTAEPFRSLVEEARRLEGQGTGGHATRILAVTLFVGCAWTDSPDTGMSVMVTADGSRATARATAVHLARRIWEARRQFAFGCETAELEAGVTRALEASEPTVFLTDSGDNVTASTPGDLPIVLRHLVERKVRRAVVAGLNDGAATAKCFEAGEGKTLRLSLGASIEKRFGPPLEAEFQVVRLVGNRRQVVGRIDDVEVILADQPTAFTDPRQFEPCGIDPLRRKLVVVKEGYLYAALTRIAPRHIMLLTPGAGDMRIESLKYTRRRRPVFPFEPDTTFEPESAPA